MIASIWTTIKHTLSQKVIAYCYTHKLDIVRMHVHVHDASSFEEECVTARAERFRACIMMNFEWERGEGGRGEGGGGWTTDIILTNDYPPHYDEHSMATRNKGDLPTQSQST